VSRWRRIAVLASLLAATAFGAEEPRLRLKNRRVAVEAEDAELRVPPAKSRIGGRAHVVVEFRGEPDRRALRELEARGARVLAYVPDAGFLVSASEDVQLDGLGVRWVGRLEAPDKLSPLLEPGEQWQCVVQFHPDVEREEAEALVREHLLEILPHPDLRRNELLVAGAPSRVQRLAEWDEVAYIYPASAELVSGEPVHACPGALTEWGPVGEYVAQIGDGWDGPGRNAAELRYYFAALARRLPRESVAAEITRALGEWARFVAIRFLPGADEWGPRTLRFYFGAGAHECPYPFDGPGRTLAHAFYPSPPNPEPIAGDIHFDDDEPWAIGAYLDVFSVALHEIGHALGLGHSDKPGSVMYPYYRKYVALTEEDIAAIRQLYAAREEPPTSPQPPTNPPTPPASPQPPANPPSNPQPTPPANPQPPGSPSPSPQPPQNPSPQPPAARDTAAPSLTITYPALSSVLVSASSITLRGTASDNVGVVEVTWSSSNGHAGTAQGTTQWTAGPIALYLGSNTITVRARDAAGNTSWRSVVVTRR
jgi:hypothetical protein